MYLTKLELSGFKSFAKRTVLTFPARVTAIVGPNGSGKSNITEAIRWALGEQSMKALRGKKGEDLVWNGSSAAPRMGKAAVSLFFDNHKKELPVAFDEVILTRKVFRDGVNEYLINDSAVRLRDVVEMIARMGLGEQKHNIIGQGDVDRLLLATPRERREMLEEALGLRVWQLKKTEAERKLDATRRNLEQADALLRELTPHLKFLRLQAKRVEAHESTRRELEDMARVYATREAEDIAAETKALAARRDPLLATLEAARKDSARLGAKIKAAEAAGVPPDMARERDRRIAALAERRQELEREIGRLEGKMEAVRSIRGQSEGAPSGLSDAAPDSDAAIDRLRDTLARIRALMREQTDIEIIRARFFPLMEKAESALEEIMRLPQPAARAPRSLPSPGARAETTALEEAVRVLGVELEQAARRMADDETARRREAEGLQAAHTRVRALEKDLRAQRDAEREALVALERLKLDEERIMERRRRLDDLADAGVRGEGSDDAALAERLKDVAQEDLYRKIERSRIKLEESGGIDAAVVKECDEAEARHEFLTREREDVASATVSLAEMIKELDRRIAQDFKEGFVKITGAFHEYFRIIFGGGIGKLRIVRREAKIKEEGEENEQAEEDKEEGIEIEVDLPRKRIHGLAMLSGGERALTAIALLFAITAVNPPPFLILDETDAALDEANSQRYAAILKELAKHTQLIVVTHNRETMKSAGVLYGVTMGDDGVSRLLSLKLEEAEGYIS